MVLNCTSKRFLMNVMADIGRKKKLIVSKTDNLTEFLWLCKYMYIGKLLLNTCVYTELSGSPSKTLSVFHLLSVSKFTVLYLSSILFVSAENLPVLASAKMR